MHIALYSPAWPPGKSANGIIPYCALIREALISHGHEVSIICGKLDADVCPPDCYVMSFEGVSLFDRIKLSLLSKLAPDLWAHIFGYKAILNAVSRLHSQKPVDVFEIEETQGWHFPISEALPFPVIMRLHGPHFLNGPFIKESVKVKKTRLKLEKKAFSTVKYLTAASKDVLEQVKEACLVSLPFAQVIYNPAPSVNLADAWSHDACNKNQLAFIGRFDLHKGGDICLLAFKKLLIRHPEAHLVFAGADTGIMDEHRNLVHIQEFIDANFESSEKSRINYVGKLPPEKLVVLRKESAITLIPSRYDNFPNTALEALSAGVPIICSDGGGMKEIVIHERNGLSFTSGDVNALAEAMYRLISDSALSIQLASQALQDAQTMFSGRQLASETVDYYLRSIADFQS